MSIVIKDGACIGGTATVFPGVAAGKGVGACAPVTKDAPPGIC